MDTTIVAVHVAASGVWLGCVLTEVLFERALAALGEAGRRPLAVLHRRVDGWVEVPAFCVVAASGGWLAARPGLDGLLAAPGMLQAKLAAAAVAVLANLVCVGWVLRRAACARRGDWAGYARADAHQHRWGAVVLLGVVAAMALGLARA